MAATGQTTTREGETPPVDDSGQGGAETDEYGGVPVVAVAEDGEP